MIFTQVEDPTPTLRAAITLGKVEGDIYRDGEVWVNAHSYWQWAKQQSAIQLAPEKLSNTEGD